jgi:hypothetical protein
MDRQGIAMDAKGIGYGCARDAACRLTDSQIHTKMCVPLFAIIYIIYNIILIL